MPETQSTILLPSGEFLPPLLTRLNQSGYKFDGQNSRRYFKQQLNPKRFAIEAGLVVRPTDIPTLLPLSQAILGIVGSDIATDQQVKPNLLRTIPFQNGIPITLIQLFATPNWTEPRSLDQLQNTRVFAPYPNLTNQWFTKQNLKLPKIEQVAGKIEGLWNIFPDNLAAVDVVTTGNTAKANQLDLIATLMPVCLVGIIRPNLTPIDQFKADFFFNSLYQLTAASISEAEPDMQKALNDSYRNG
jgi:ATP phosphoribosyltransferase